MTQRNSLQDTNGTVWNQVPLRLGTRGIDLRRPDDPGVLSELLNARFLDDRTVKRRDGHAGRAIQSPVAGEAGGFYEDGAFRPTAQWAYGHGTVVTRLDDDSIGTTYHPVHARGGGVFQFGDSDVVWTGDRVFIVSDDGPFYGGEGDGFFAVDYPAGYQAMLPVQTDEVHLAGVTGSYFELALTSRFKVVVATTSGNDVIAWTFDRQTGALVDQTTLLSATPITRLRALNSNDTPLVFWLDDTDVIKRRYFNGTSWVTASTVQSSVDDMDACETPGGCHLVWRAGSDIKVGHYVGSAATSTPFAFATVVDTTGGTPDGRCTIATSPAGDVAIAWNAQDGGGHDKVFVRCYTPALEIDTDDIVTGDATELTSTDDHTPWTITAAYTGLRDSFGRYMLHVFGGRDDEAHQWSLRCNDAVDKVQFEGFHHIRYNSRLASKAFRVDHQVFCWYQSDNSSTNYLHAASESEPAICGVSDREEAVDAPAGWLPGIQLDPDEAYVRHWPRKRDVGDYVRVGNLRIGSIDFLPKLSVAHYGESAYLAGSLVRNWDGVQMGDAGFHDYPTVASHATDTDGALTAPGEYQWRVYPVRYNAKGERFQGPAITYAATTLAGQDEVTLYINTMPCTNHSDVEYEVYRTEHQGTTFYYEGKVSHDPNAEQVLFVSTIADAALRDNVGDSFAAGVGNQSEVEEFGPIGCATLVTGADRMWGFGGQVPTGTAQFSKLFSLNEGVSFDPLNSVQVLDAEGKPLTSLACINDAAIVAFQRDQFYVLLGSGPDNYGVGAFSTPQVVTADGALNHQGTIALPIGLAYWGSGGPRMMTSGFEVENISEPVKPLADTMVPSGVRVDRARCEVTWYTEEGDALLWNYAAGNYASSRTRQSDGSRWARWSGLKIAGCCPTSLVTTAGRYLVPVEDLAYDDGKRFVFKLRTGNARLEELLQGGMLLGRAGMIGEYLAEHEARFRIYYDGSKMWSETLDWEPADNTWLVTGEDLATLTPAEIDVLENVDRSGRYSTHYRVQRQTCQFFQFEVSDRGVAGFIPWEFVFSIGAKPDLGRTPVNTMTRS